MATRRKGAAKRFDFPVIYELFSFCLNFVLDIRAAACYKAWHTRKSRRTAGAIGADFFMRYAGEDGLGCNVAVKLTEEIKTFRA